MPQLNRGVLIAIEGIDGSGKTVLAQNLYNTFTDKTFDVILTKEPGGSDLGKPIRNLLQEQPISIEPKAEYLLYAADRAQHFQQIIIPALAQNRLIISDRLGDSSIAYQGYGRGIDIGMITTINQWAMNDIEPDIICYVQIDAQTARTRLQKREKLSAFDQKPLAFFQKLIEGFETIFKKKKNVITLDGSQSPAVVSQHAMEEIFKWLQKNNLI